jgi:para-nitrobenzyl esterase
MRPGRDRPAQARPQFGGDTTPWTKSRRLCDCQIASIGALAPKKVIRGDNKFALRANLFSLSVPTFAYEFNDENVPTTLLPAVSFPYGATHTDELQFLFTLAGAPSALSSSEQSLATSMKSYWTSFANSGSPNSHQTPAWAPFVLAAGNVQSLNTPRPAVELNFATEHHCNFWLGILSQTILENVAADLTSHGIVD